MTAQARRSDEMLEHARALVQALEAGDERAQAQAIQWIAGGELMLWQRELKQIAESLRDTLCGSQVTRELSRLAHRELPDAKQSLGYVLELTEDAAHRTLEAVETALPLASNLARSVAECKLRWQVSSTSVSAEGDEAFRALLDCAETECTELKASLSDVLMAQGFQDLTGQIIRRVGDLVSELEQHLATLGPVPEDAASLRVDTLHQGMGTQVPGSDASDSVSGQDDVDDLLAQLGV
ncbi:MAG: protein phosphatase CheZ [Gammaproteobacteria bacterium]|nr:MAG: protein phosphatase CheZ [Gammaproteobacteria bacterium]